MGITSSRHQPDTVITKNGLESECTPKPTRILPFDPRSPPDNFSRTPIAVVANTPSKDTETPVVRNVKTLFLDPRSPTTQVSRTPIVFEEQGNGKRFQPIKPSKLLEGNLLLTPTSGIDRESLNDPRSPTVEVPRTPLEETNDLKIMPSENEKDIQENLKVDPKLDVGPNLPTETSILKERLPLSCLQNKNSSQPKKQIQALQCKSVEDEFTKNENIILKKLDKQELTLPTNTEFVEDI